MQIFNILFSIFLCVCLRSTLFDNSCIRCQIGEDGGRARCVLILLDKLFSLEDLFSFQDNYEQSKLKRFLLPINHLR